MLVAALLLHLPLTGCNSSERGKDGGFDDSLPLDRIRLPQGFKISLFATGVKEARSMAVSPGGIVYVGNKFGDKVYALKDTNNDFRADEKYVVARGLKMPNGIAFKDNDLYIAERHRITRLAAIDNNLDALPAAQLIYDRFPDNMQHGWKYMAFGPDGKLYIPIGAPCNSCESKHEVHGTIARMNADGTGFEIIAKGVRNSLGLDWHPVTGKLWFTDNGRDLLGDDSPPCELNTLEEEGAHFGFPYCHGGQVPDPELGGRAACDRYVKPIQKLPAHVAPLGMRFYTGKMFPKSYVNQIFIAEHGSWNRTTKVGYRISLVKLKDGKAISYEPFAEGWLDKYGMEAWGRPVDIAQLPDGSLLVSDDKANAIYRIYVEK